MINPISYLNGFFVRRISLVLGIFTTSIALLALIMMPATKTFAESEIVTEPYESITADSVGVTHTQAYTLALGTLSGTVLGDEYGLYNPIPCAVVSVMPEPTWDIGAGVGQPISQLTDINGEYLFENLPGHTTTIYTTTLVSTPHRFTTINYSPDGDADSQFVTELSLINLEVEDQDFGLEIGHVDGFANIGNSVWIDVDGDGDAVLDGADVPLEGATVILIPPSDIDLGAGLGASITTITDASGNYLFDSVPADQGYILPDGCDPSLYPRRIVYTVEVDLSSLPVEAGVVSYDRDGVLDAKTESYPTLTFNIHDLDADFSFMPAVPTSVEMTNQMLVDTNAYLVFSIVSAFVLLGLISALVFKREI